MIMALQFQITPMGHLKNAFSGLILIYFFIIFPSLASSDSYKIAPNFNCPTTRCHKGRPKIHFPFHLQGTQQYDERCSYPGYEVSCNGNDTVLRLPSFNGPAVAVVRKIDYSSQILHVASTNGCIRKLFWDLDLSSSPFQYHPFHDYYSGILSNFTFVNCSAGVEDYPYYRIDCMSDSEHHVFLFPADTSIDELPISCQATKTVAVPWSYYFHHRHNDYAVLKWSMPGCKGCDEAKGGICGFKDRAHTNQTACFYNPHHHSSWKKQVIIGSTVGCFILLAATLISVKVYLSWKLKRQKDIENQLKVEKFLKDYKSLKPTRYSFADLKKMTDQFREKLGQGGFGTVYKGKLGNGLPVAVKVLQKLGGNGEDFINEVGTIGRIHHVNVVRLLGFCSENFKRALIYEFMPNESLEKFIFSSNVANPSLGWDKLQHIAIGIARGIEYLHQGCDQRILHFDIKPHNILLDRNFNPKITDFGLAKLSSKAQSIVSMTAARGTMGYIAPEIFSRNFGNVSYKSDVYSFGMLLLEMVGGRKNVDTTVENTSQVYFPEWIYNRLKQGEGMELNIATDDDDAEMAKKLSIVALWCIQWYPVDRPSMKTVVQMLEGSMESLTMPPNPFASTSHDTDRIIGENKTQVAPLTSIAELEERQEDDLH